MTETLEKILDAKRKTREAEKRRVLYGFEQQTKLKVVRQPVSKTNLRYAMKKAGYIEEGRVMWYDNNTRRSTKREVRASQFGIEVKEKI